MNVDAFRETSLVHKLREENGCARVAFARFEHHRVATHQAERKHPERDHGREVEGRNARGDPQRDTHRVGVHILRDPVHTLAQT